MIVKDLAVARSGDKGDVVNIALMAVDERSYWLLLRAVTIGRVEEFFEGWVHGPVERFELPKLLALNYVLHGALDGGVGVSLRIDALGKAMGLALLRMGVDDKEDSRGDD